MFEDAIPAAIDAAGRLRLPRSVVEAIDERVGDRRLFVTMVGDSGVLLFPMKAWEAVEARLTKPSGAGKDVDRRSTKMLFLVNYCGAEVGIDDHGSVALPPQLRASFPHDRVRLRWIENHIRAEGEDSEESLPPGRGAVG